MPAPVVIGATASVPRSCAAGTGASAAAHVSDAADAAADATDGNIEVFGDAKLCCTQLNEKIHSGMCRDVEWSIFEGVVQNYGSLVLDEM